MGLYLTDCITYTMARRWAAGPPKQGHSHPCPSKPRWDLVIIPPVLCHMGFVLGGIQSAATTKPEVLLLHTQIQTQTHQ